MAKVKVYAPNTTYGGTVGSARFEGGVAEVDEDAPEMAYFRKAGYGIGTKPDADAGLPADKLEPTVDGKPIDARDYATSTPFGSPLRDAAVDPKPGDYLAPTNAGKANPHGPSVVSPQIHDAVGPKPLRPGEVHVDDADEQERKETALVQAVLVEGQPAVTGEPFNGDLDEGNMGPLGLSDPGSVGMGQVARAVAEADARTAAPTPTSTPKRTTTAKAAPRKRSSSAKPKSGGR
jgi:hypothetical protein